MIFNAHYAQNYAGIIGASLLLAYNKCMFNQCPVSFLGHLMNDKEISQDPQKTMAIAKMSQRHN